MIPNSDLAKSKRELGDNEYAGGGVFIGGYGCSTTKSLWNKLVTRASQKYQILAKIKEMLFLLMWRSMLITMGEAQTTMKGW